MSLYKVLQCDASLNQFELQCSELIEKGYIPCTTLFVNGTIVQTFYLDKSKQSTQSAQSVQSTRKHKRPPTPSPTSDTDDEMYEPPSKRQRNEKVQDWQKMMYS